MNKKEEIEFLSNDWMQIIGHLEAFSATGDQEALHRLRVQIKKVRAMLVFFELTTGKHKLLIRFKPVKKIFKYAGSIRNAHVNLQLSGKYNLKNEVFETGQRQIIDEGATIFKHNRKKFVKKIKFTFKKIKKRVSRISDHSIAGYYQIQLEKIASGLSISDFTEGMHKNRKLIKNLVYNHKLAEKALNNSLTFNKTYLDKLQESIGKWHDNVVAVKLFSSAGVDDKPVVNKIKKINTGVKRQITLLANNFLQKATTVEPA